MNWLKCYKCDQPVTGRGRRSPWLFVGGIPVHLECPRKRKNWKLLRKQWKRVNAKSKVVKLTAKEQAEWSNLKKLFDDKIKQDKVKTDRAILYHLYALPEAL